MSAAYGSDVVAGLLADLGIAHLAQAPGASLRGLHDSLVHLGRPELITCLHEEVSVAVAHGYAKAAGRPMAVGLHDVVGLQHATMAIYNAWCDRVPMLLIGGTGPVDAARRRPWIDGIHTASLQALQIRDYTRWDDQPGSLEAVPESLIRAHRLAVGTPPGPVYVCLDSEIQEREVPDGFRPPAVADYALPRPVAPDPAAIAELADRLAGAERPLFMVGGVDRDQRALEDLTALAELLGAAVVEPVQEYNRPALCFPTGHPLNATGLGSLDPDVAVAVEWPDFRGVPGAWTAEIGTLSFAVKAWAADLQRIAPTALTVPAGAAPSLRALRVAVQNLLEGAPREEARTRSARLGERTSRRRAAWRAAATSQNDPRAWIAHAVDEATRGHDRVLANGTLGDWTHRLWSIGRTDAYLGGSGGAGLGYGLGASIGAALAHRSGGRLVVDLQSDGDALMSPQALWTAAHHRLPLLIVVDDNRVYGNSVRHAEQIAVHRGRDPARRLIGTAVDAPAVDLTAMARSFGVTAEPPVTRPDDLPAALERAVATVTKERRPVLVGVQTGGDDGRP
ncbi:thiamine pyrophosphate-binding protein [Rhizohabitans arisaemae]|uniref:thiamine pyrophosphate-binding protein n=1 Tax=Rhizohabitans arisaemae TaxID=2720610 RepID=UPI0024B06E76|nr:thiamine pyrophosphate-dependent enzyme [Rhizohabitans arisaemae]